EHVLSQGVPDEDHGNARLIEESCDGVVPGGQHGEPPAFGFPGTEVLDGDRHGSRLLVLSARLAVPLSVPRRREGNPPEKEALASTVRQPADSSSPREGLASNPSTGPRPREARWPENAWSPCSIPAPRDPMYRGDD